jgi:3-dehydroquinate synthetase
MMLDLPYIFPKAEDEILSKTLFSDKKIRGNTMNLAILERLGKGMIQSMEIEQALKLINI